MEEEKDDREVSVLVGASVTVVNDEVVTDAVANGDLVTEGLEVGDFDVCTDCVLVIVPLTDEETDAEDGSELETRGEDENDARDDSEAVRYDDTDNDAKFVPELDSMAVDESLLIGDGENDSKALADGKPLSEELLLKLASWVCVFVVAGDILLVVSEEKERVVTAEFEFDINDDGEVESTALYDGDSLNE